MSFAPDYSRIDAARARTDAAEQRSRDLLMTAGKFFLHYYMNPQQEGWADKYAKDLPEEDYIASWEDQPETPEMKNKKIMEEIHNWK